MEENTPMDISINWEPSEEIQDVSMQETGSSAPVLDTTETPPSLSDSKGEYYLKNPLLSNSTEELFAAIDNAIKNKSAQEKENISPLAASAESEESLSNTMIIKDESNGELNLTKIMGDNLMNDSLHPYTKSRRSVTLSSSFDARRKPAEMLNLTTFNSPDEPIATSTPPCNLPVASKEPTETAARLPLTPIDTTFEIGNADARQILSSTLPSDNQNDINRSYNTKQRASVPLTGHGNSTFIADAPPTLQTTFDNYKKPDLTFDGTEKHANSTFDMLSDVNKTLETPTTTDTSFDNNPQDTTSTLKASSCTGMTTNKTFEAQEANKTLDAESELPSINVQEIDIPVQTKHLLDATVPIINVSLLSELASRKSTVCSEELQELTNVSKTSSLIGINNSSVLMSDTTLPLPQAADGPISPDTDDDYLSACSDKDSKRSSLNPSSDSDSYETIKSNTSIGEIKQNVDLKEHETTINSSSGGGNETVIEILDDEDNSSVIKSNDDSVIEIDSSSETSFKSPDGKPMNKIVNTTSEKCVSAEQHDADNVIQDYPTANKENLYDLSFFSNSPAKVQNSDKRDSIFTLFDPLGTQQKPSSTVTEAQKDIRVSVLVPINEDPIDYKKIYHELKNVFLEGEEESDDNVPIEEFIKSIPRNLRELRANMDDISEQKMLIEQELNELKLQLNQMQQERTNSAKELLLKDEVILKMQGESQKRENQYKQEIKQLNEKLHSISEQNNNEEVSALKRENEKIKEEKSELQERLNKCLAGEAAAKRRLREYEETLSTMTSETDKLKQENERAKQHLATLELSFSDVHAKYERSKDIIVGFKSNEEALLSTIEKSVVAAKKMDERYESLKSHVKTQLEKANKDLALMKEKHASEVNKLSTLIKRLEIKNGSIQQALDQKTEECNSLAALCDELTGSGPQ